MYSGSMEKGSSWKPNVDQVSPACPRCGSSHTKFCYYNNYSLTQPRYFCKGCRRYWTKGGSLRNVPIGGGCHKSRRSKSVRVSAHYANDSSSRNLGHANGVEQATSSSSADAIASTNIDLATVYANFLRQKPQVEAQNTDHSSSFSELPDGMSMINPVIDKFPNFQNLHVNEHQFSTSERHLPRDIITTTAAAATTTTSTTGFLEWGAFNFPPTFSRFSELSSNSSLFGGGSNATYFQGFESINEKQELTIATGNNFLSMNNFGLGDHEDVTAAEGVLWPNSDLILPNHTFHSNQQGEPSMHNSEPLSGNIVTPFSPLNLEAIFRS